MLKRMLAIVSVGTMVMCAATVLAQQTRISPHETTGKVIDGNRVTVIYGRPYAKDHKTGAERKIWGGLVPYGKVWRLGADEATLLITQRPIVLGGTALPAGAYTLFMVPDEGDQSKLIINKQIGQWGLQYDEKQDVARVDLTTGTLDKPVEQFTMAVEKNAAGGGGGMLRLMWEGMQFSVPFTVEKK